MAVEVQEKIVTESTQQNRFVAGFLVPYRPQLEDLYSLEAEISTERINWQSSGATEELFAEYIRNVEEAGIIHRLNDPKMRDKMLKDIEFNLYGNSEVSKKALQAVDNVLKKTLPPKADKVIQQYQEGILDRMGEFQTAIRPLTEQRESAIKQVMEVWQTFMIASPMSFTSFVDYLECEEFVNSREENRPFLRVLQRRGNIIEPTSRIFVERQLVNPDPEILGEFISRNFVQTSKDGVARDWLLLLSYPDEDVNSKLVAEMICEADILPRDLKQSYQNYLHNLVSPLSRRIQALLEDYRIQQPTASLNYDTQFVRGGSSRGHKTTIIQPRVKLNHEGEIEKREKPEYKLVVVRRGEPVELTGDVRERYITNIADQFSGNDSVMRDDIQKIIDSLQEDPYGLGVGKLTDFKTTSLDQKRSLVLRKYRADRRPEVPLGSSKAKILRAVFYFDPHAYPNTVFIDEVLHHQDFDIKYGKAD